MKIAAIVPAAGLGRRLKTKAFKPFVRILGKPLLVHTLESLKKSFDFAEIIVAAAPAKLDETLRLLRRHKLHGVRVVLGGRNRSGSVRNALLNVSGDCDWVLVHDAARPFVGRVLVRRLLNAAKATGAAIAATPVTATVKRSGARKDVIFKTEDRERLFLAQTPQLFRKGLLAKRYRTLGAKALLCTDEAALFDRSRVRVRLVPGDPKNIKITAPEDIKLFKFYLNDRHSERA